MNDVERMKLEALLEVWDKKAKEEVRESEHDCGLRLGFSICADGLRRVLEVQAVGIIEKPQNDQHQSEL